MGAGAEDALRRGPVVRITREKDVIHKRLWVAIIEREPTALDLHHDSVALKEGVVVGVQIDFVFNDLVCWNWFRLRK